MISVYGKGVLICGESGMGKSETALELIRKGHILVADDRVDVVRVHNSIIGHSPELLQGMLESAASASSTSQDVRCERVIAFGSDRPGRVVGKV